MKQIITYLVVMILLEACSSKKDKETNIETLNKETIYIKKMKKIITTVKAPAPIGPYNQAILTGNTLYTSGQIAFNPETGELVLDNIQAETRQVMENLKQVLLAADMTFENVIKTAQ